MSFRLLTLLKNDFLLLFRYGIIAAYSVVIAFYIGAFIYAGSLMPSWMAGLIIIMEPSVFGFFFLGALMQLEKSEDVRSGLAITPISAMEYFLAKAISLTLIGLLAVIILVNFTHNEINWVMLITIVILTSVQFIAIGVPAALFFKTLSGYLLGSVTIVMPLLLLGMIAFINPMPFWALFIPTTAQFKLILLGTGAGSATILEISIMFIVVIITLIFSILLAIKTLEKELGRK